MITGYFIDIGEPISEEAHRKLLAKVNGIGKEEMLKPPTTTQYAKLAGKLLLYKLLCDHNLDHSLFIDRQEINRWGKPYFASADFDYNLSHSGNIVFCAGGLAARIGVDIEQEKERDIAGMREYFSEREWYKINSSNNINAEFYKMWVRKEACIKAIGKGVFQPLQEIDVCDDVVIEHGMRWFLQDVLIKTGYACCIATNKKKDVTIEEVDLNKLLS